MKNSTLHISQLDSILKQDALTPNLELFHDILDIMANQSGVEFTEEKVQYFLGTFEQILLSGGLVSESDAKVFLAFISSREFRKAYINVVKNMSYLVDNSQINEETATRISRNNNPLFKLFDLQLELEALIIKSRINDNLKKGNLVTQYDNGKFIRVNNEDNEIIDQNGNIFILLNPAKGYGLYRATKKSTDDDFTGYELISESDELEDIQPSYQSAKYKFYTFHVEGKTYLYDLNKWKIIVECDEVHTFTEMGNDCYIHLKRNGGDYIFSTVFGSELFHAKDFEKRIEVIDHIGDSYLVLQDDDGYYTIVNAINPKIFHKNLIRFKVVGKYLEFQDFFGIGLSDLSNMELLVKTPGFFSLELDSSKHNSYVRYGTQRDITLYDLKRNESVLYGKKVLEIKSIPKGEIAYFVDHNGEGIYDIGNSRILLEGVRDIDINTATYEKTGYTEISYKKKGVFSRKQILTY